MPYKDKPIQKMYYTIGEVATMLHVNTSHIRFWSKQFDVIKPATNKKGNRLFTVSDIENFKVIFHLVKEKGFTLKGAKVEMQAMRKKMKIEQNPSMSKLEITPSSEPATQEIESLLQPFAQPVADQQLVSDDYVDKLALVKSLEKIKTTLLEIQKSMSTLATA
jgi:DNA-binding transcriptional MerR regulator